MALKKESKKTPFLKNFLAQSKNLRPFLKDVRLIKTSFKNTYKLKIGLLFMKDYIIKRKKVSSLLKINKDPLFHKFFISDSMELFFQSLKEKRRDTSILSLGANHIEAEELTKYPFSKIVLSGISEPDKGIKEALNKDKRVSYKKADMEKLPFKTNSFDLVFVKEALHHVARPIQALYEMLRVSKKAVIFIEPAETPLGNLLERLGLTSRYERNHKGNKEYRDNYVYRWRKKEVIKILNSYFLESGYKAIFSYCWMSNRFNSKFPNLIKFMNFFGWLVSFFPFSRGNYLTCVIFEGKDKPED